jgi:hypothetical protein
LNIAGNRRVPWISRHRSEARNPKLEPNPATNTEKDPDDWVSCDAPMTGAQASYLKTLAEQASEPHAYQDNLTKAEASKRIDALKQALGISDSGCNAEGDADATR